MNHTTISVIIPTRNRPETLVRAVTSVGVQSRPVDEIIVVDDGSTPPVDPDEFADMPVAVIVVRSDVSVGAAAARNLGVARATGDFVAFLDDDDRWTPEKLEFVDACLREHPDTDVVIHRSSYETASHPSSMACSPVGDPFVRMIRSQPPHLDGVTVRCAIHMDGPFDETLTAAEDVDYLIRLARLGASMTEGTAVLAVLGQDEPSLIGIDARIQGRLSLLSRHPEILADDEARSFFYVRLGHLQRRGDQWSRSVGSFITAIRAWPRSGVAWKGLVRTLISRWNAPDDSDDVRYR